MQQFIFFSNSLYREQDSTRDFITQKLLPCGDIQIKRLAIEKKIVKKHRAFIFEIAYIYGNIYDIQFECNNNFQKKRNSNQK